jgi:hypothetical protein
LINSREWIKGESGAQNATAKHSVQMLPKGIASYADTYHKMDKVGTSDSCRGWNTNRLQERLENARQGHVFLVQKANRI